MDAPTATRVTDWLKALRGTETQEALALDITSKTGWKITRDRYSKYESGSLPIGPTVYEHFLTYWKGRGKQGPDLAPASTGATESDDPLVIALTRQSIAIERLVALLEGDLPARVAALEPVVLRLAELDLEGRPRPTVPRETEG